MPPGKQRELCRCLSDGIIVVPIVMMFHEFRIEPSHTVCHACSALLATRHRNSRAALVSHASNRLILQKCALAGGRPSRLSSDRHFLNGRVGLSAESTVLSGCRPRTIIFLLQLFLTMHC